VALLGLLGVPLACSKTVADGGLEVLIATNLTTPTEFDTVAVTVSQQTSGGAWKVDFQNSFTIPGEATLPSSFSIAAGSGSDQLALIQVVALKNGNPIDLREAEVQVPTNRVAQLTMILAESCVGDVTIDNDEPASKCPANESCQPATGTCGPTLITTPLPTYSPSALAQIDASVGRVRLDAGHDAPHTRDAGHDATHHRPDAARDSGQDAPVDAPPEPLAIPSSANATALAADTSFVYWCAPADGGGASIMQAPLDGGRPKLFVGVESCGGLAVDDESVYWTDPKAGTVASHAKASEAGAVFATTENQPAAVAVNASDLYWITATGLQRVSLTGGMPKSVWAACHAPEHLLTLDSENAFCPVCNPVLPCGDAGPTVGVIPLQAVDGKGAEVLQGGGTLSGFAAQSGDVYQAYYDDGLPILRDQVDGGDSLDSGWGNQPAPGGMAADSTYVYWTISNTSEGFSNVPYGGTGVVAAKPGETPVTLAAMSAPAQPTPPQLAQNAGFVMWTTPTAVLVARKPR
jgi:hypothetical protein